MDIYLNFHGLGVPGSYVPEEEKPYWLPLRHFETVLEFVQTARRRVHITFDDGNLSDLKLALPALHRAGLSATFFILSQRIGAPHYLGREDIRALRAAGMRIGSHGDSHVRWTSLSDEVLANQVANSIATLSKIIEEPVRAVAIPFGAYNGRVLAVLWRMGVERVYTSDGGSAASFSWVIPRASIRVDQPLSHIYQLVSQPQPLVDTFDFLRSCGRRIIAERLGRWS